MKEKFPSRDHTEILLKYLGADIKKEKNIITLKSPNFLKPKDLFVPGDFSSAAFLIVAALITKGSKIIIENVGLNFFRTGLLEVLKKNSVEELILRPILACFHCSPVLKKEILRIFGILSSEIESECKNKYFKQETL